MADVYEEVEEPVILDRTGLAILSQMKTMTDRINGVARGINQINGVKMTLSEDGGLSVTGGFSYIHGLLGG